MEGSITVIAPEVNMYWLLKCHLLCQYSYSASDRVFLFGQTDNSLNSYPSLVTQELTLLPKILITIAESLIMRV